MYKLAWRKRNTAQYDDGLVVFAPKPPLQRKPRRGGGGGGGGGSGEIDRERDRG